MILANEVDWIVWRICKKLTRDDAQCRQTNFSKHCVCLLFIQKLINKNKTMQPVEKFT